MMHAFIFTVTDKSTVGVISGKGITQTRYNMPVRLVLNILDDLGYANRDKVSIVENDGWSIINTSELIRRLNERL